MRPLTLSVAALVMCMGQAQADQPPNWLDSFAVTPPDESGVGTYALSGWHGDLQGGPDTIFHEITDTRIDIYVGSLIPAGPVNPAVKDWLLQDSFGPPPPGKDWILQGSFGPLPAGTYSIYGSLFAYPELDPEIHYPVAGPDLLFDAYVVPEPSTVMLLTLAVLALLAIGWRRRRAG